MRKLVSILLFLLCLLICMKENPAQAMQSWEDYQKSKEKSGRDSAMYNKMCLSLTELPEGQQKMLQKTVSKIVQTQVERVIQNQKSPSIAIVRKEEPFPQKNSICHSFAPAKGHSKEFKHKPRKLLKREYGMPALVYQSSSDYEDSFSDSEDDYYQWKKWE